MRAAALDIKATLSSEELIGFVKSVCNIRMSRCANDNHLISIYGWMRFTLRKIDIPRDRYEDLIKETVTQLAERHGSDLRVEIRSDHYGSQWVEVHSGFLGRRTSRLGLSPHHIVMLQNSLHARAQVEIGTALWAKAGGQRVDSKKSVREKLQKRPTEAIEFIHKQPALPNLGDHLSSPKHYYNFVAEPSAGSVAVIGGGTHTDFAVGKVITLKHNHKVLWGIGRSVSVTCNPPLNFTAIDRLYDFCSTRDPDWARNGVRLVPCVSVFHPINDVVPGARVGLFLNASPGTSGARIDDLVREHAARQANLVVATDAMPESTFVRAFAKTDRLVTNSYHVAYWGLLSGRAVTVIGYSSKFSSVLRLLEQDPDSVIQYRKGDDDALATAIDHALSEPPRARLADPNSTRTAFREINDHFAADLVRAGLFQSITRRGCSRHPNKRELVS